MFCSLFIDVVAELQHSFVNLVNVCTRVCEASCTLPAWGIFPMFSLYHVHLYLSGFKCYKSVFDKSKLCQLSYYAYISRIKQQELQWDNCGTSDKPPLALHKRWFAGFYRITTFANIDSCSSLQMQTLRCWEGIPILRADSTKSAATL